MAELQQCRATVQPSEWRLKPVLTVLKAEPSIHSATVLEIRLQVKLLSTPLVATSFIKLKLCCKYDSVATNLFGGLIPFFRLTRMLFLVQFCYQGNMTLKICHTMLCQMWTPSEPYSLRLRSDTTPIGRDRGAASRELELVNINSGIGERPLFLSVGFN